MEKRNKIYFFTNGEPAGLNSKAQIETLIQHYDFEVTDNHQTANIIASIGGDGEFLQAVRKTKFRQDAIYVGIATDDKKHFYTDFHIDDTQLLNKALNSEDESIEVRKYPLLDVNINSEMHYLCLNDFYIKSSIIKSMSLDVLIDDQKFETFRGDGMLISTPTGSTGYSKSLDGAIIDPLTRCFQMTEIASFNNNNYRTIGNAIILNENRKLSLILDKLEDYYPIMGLDNEALSIQNTDTIDITLSNKIIKTIKVKENSFWNKVERTFL
ncbi:NAD kinase [Macrococcoides canis]|uniref:NAD kinase n=1 Tax=Macrococcoides canis TaxID=1855823 RepID=UPI0010FC231A|nr:NAD kinase [Macrococcus canis]QCT75178.1 NAD kinase [Macrococcus canis]